MEWLNKRLYEKEEVQNEWVDQEWKDLWSQLVHTINYAGMRITQELIDNCIDESQKHYMKRLFPKQQYAENEILSWDLNRMSNRVKTLIKAELMQRKSYYTFLRKFPNLEKLNDTVYLEEPLYLSRSGIEPFRWYKYFNIRM